MQVFTSVMVLGLCFAAFIINDIKGYKERKVKSMTGLAKVVGSNSISALEFLDSDAAAAILSDLHKISPEVRHAFIFDKKGNIFATYAAGKDTFSFNHVLYPGDRHEFSKDYLLVYNKIINNNEIIGTVCLQVKLSELAAIKRQKYQIAAILLITGIALAFVIAHIVQPYISRRLLYLVNIMNQVSKTADYTKHVVVEGKDEITTLSFVFNNLMDQILEGHKKKDEFIGIASHELKTPLTSIKAYLQVLESMEDKQPNKLYIERANQNVNKLELLLYDLLDVSKIQSGQLRLNLDNFNIDSLVDETIAAIQIVSPRHKIIRQGSPVDHIIFGDKQRIEQVLVNILSNAIKYSPDTEEILVHTYTNDSEVIIGIRDFGIGIPKEEQGKIFERFYRTKDITRHISGFGLGLYICKDIIKRHNGKIWIESEGSGSAFFVSLPLRNSFATAPEKF